MTAEDGKKGRKASGRWKYINDYELDDNGQYRYKGDYYSYGLPANRLVKMKIIYSALTLLSVSIYILIGFLDVGSSRVLYVALPYAALFLPLALMVADVFKIIIAKCKLTLKQYNNTVVQLKNMTIVVIVAAAISAVGDALFIIINGIYAMNNELFYILGCLMLVAVNLIFFKLQGKFPCTVNKK